MEAEIIDVIIPYPNRNYKLYVSLKVLCNGTPQIMTCYFTQAKILSRGREGVEGRDGGGDLINVQYKPI
jgi:hypothetical protein